MRSSSLWPAGGDTRPPLIMLQFIFFTLKLSFKEHIVLVDLFFFGLWERSVSVPLTNKTKLWWFWSLYRGSEGPFGGSDHTYRSDRRFWLSSRRWWFHSEAHSGYSSGSIGHSCAHWECSVGLRLIHSEILEAIKRFKNSFCGFSVSLECLTVTNALRGSNGNWWGSEGHVTVEKVRDHLGLVLCSFRISRVPWRSSFTESLGPLSYCNFP